MYTPVSERHTRFQSSPWQALQGELADLRMGDLSVRLAENDDDIHAAQQLRYRIFYDEMKARPSAEMVHAQRDFDALDRFCDHLLVIDNNRGSGYESVVGTYRLVSRKMAVAHGSFYSGSEYDISCIESYPGEVLELGRSCVDADYRNGTTMQLLWRGLATYVFAHGIQLMFGCASLTGTDIATHRQSLAYLHHYHPAEPGLCPRALPGRYISMNTMAREEVNVKQALQELPPLIKGYLRVGALVGDGAVIDWQFNTTDVFIVLKTDLVTDKYIKHYRRSVPGGTMVV